MAQDEKQWHPRFLKYMSSIINHPNYSGLPIKKRSDNSYAWIATAKSEVGRGRINWCIDKAIKLGFIKTRTVYPGMYADVMLEIHPTKWKVCQICGKEMSLYTDRNQHETDRYKRIALNSVYDYAEKDNRNSTQDLTSSELQNLKSICNCIESGESDEENKQRVISLMESIEKRIISSL